LPALESAYSRFISEQISYPDLAYKKKKQVMDILLAVEMRTLGRYLSVLAEQDRYARELSREELTRALVETTACLEPYRTYVRGFEVRPQDRNAIIKALREAQRRNPTVDAACFQFLQHVLLLEPGPHLLPEQREAQLAFVMTWQQFTGPITAKGVEDSALYVYNRLISLNEVGGTPQSPDTSKPGFDNFLLQRQKKWPFAMNASMTHDAKRSEDVRARINVLSEIPEAWETRLNNWTLWNDSRCQSIKGVRAPERNEEALLYQTLLGSWPIGEQACACYTRRIQDFMVKAVREAMVHTRWTVPNLKHERALTCFVEAILQESPDNRFLQDFKPFAANIAYHGALNSLSQLVIKLASPGVPDFYQGAEMWDLRLVDPDNRRPVDFNHRAETLARIRDHSPSPTDLVTRWEDGEIKMFVTRCGLLLRRNHPSLFLKGDYIPLEVRGPQSECLIAMARRYRGAWCAVAVPRFTTRLMAADDQLWGNWGDSRIMLPREAPLRWVDVFTSSSTGDIESDDRTLSVSRLLRRFPVAMLLASP
jgi:(1->4)-alpha-D-glucan 1-alpha-D-glucosylmutase